MKKIIACLVLSCFIASTAFAHCPCHPVKHGNPWRPRPATHDTVVVVKNKKGNCVLKMVAVGAVAFTAGCLIGNSWKSNDTKIVTVSSCPEEPKKDDCP